MWRFNDGDAAHGGRNGKIEIELTITLESRFI